MLFVQGWPQSEILLSLPPVWASMPGLFVEMGSEMASSHNPPDLCLPGRWD
jgi:hypothetical protein